MARTKSVNTVLNAPDLPPAGTRIEIVILPDGTWEVSATVPLDGSVHIRSVKFTDVGAVRQGRVSLAAENLYDEAMKAMGYITA